MPHPRPWPVHQEARPIRSQASVVNFRLDRLFIRGVAWESAPSRPSGGEGRSDRNHHRARREDHLSTTEIYLNLSPEHVIQEFREKW
jgi:hypothetical protein